MTRRVTIPKLAAFLQDFTEEHRAQPVTLEVMVGSTLNVQESGVPLVGLDLDTKQGNGPALEIILGDEALGEMRHLTHTVYHVSGVTVEVDAKGDERRLLFEGDEGTQAVLSID